MSDKSKIEHEVAELKNLLSDAENRLKLLELEQADMKAAQGKNMFKHLKKALVAIAITVVAVKLGKTVCCRHKSKKELFNPELNEGIEALLQEGKKQLKKKLK